VGLIETSVLVAAPPEYAFDRWTEWESFPQFMPGVLEVENLDSGQVRWKVRAAGRDAAWVGEILALKPGASITWRSSSGLRTAGTVSFIDARPDFNGTRLAVLFEYNPPGWLIGDLIDEWFYHHRMWRAVAEALAAFAEHVNAEFSQTEAGQAFAAGARRGRRRETAAAGLWRAPSGERRVSG